MPSVNYRDGLIKRLEKDPEYASLLLEISLQDALENGYMDAFPLALKDVIEATNNRSETLSQVDLLRKALYERLIREEKPLSKEKTLSALKNVGLNIEMKPLKSQLITP